jgi:hypothetical protein
MTWLVAQEIRAAVRKVDPRADADVNLYAREYRVDCPVKVKGAGVRWFRTYVADASIEDGTTPEHVAAFVRSRRDRLAARLVVKVRRDRMRMERAARKRRRGWA